MADSIKDQHDSYQGGRSPPAPRETTPPQPDRDPTHVESNTPENKKGQNQSFRTGGQQYDADTRRPAAIE